MKFDNESDLTVKADGLSKPGVRFYRNFCKVYPRPKKKTAKRPKLPKSMVYLGFHLNAEDIYNMYLAEVCAVKFMENFGKGEKSYSIDLAHFENSSKKKI